MAAVVLRREKVFHAFAGRKAVAEGHICVVRHRRGIGRNDLGYGWIRREHGVENVVIVTRVVRGDVDLRGALGDERTKVVELVIRSRIGWSRVWHRVICCVAMTANGDKGPISRLSVVLSAGRGREPCPVNVDRAELRVALKTI